MTTQQTPAGTPAKTTKRERQNFARRFSLEDWNRLCSRLDFLDALDRDLSVAEVIAWQILTGQESNRLAGEGGAS